MILACSPALAAALPDPGPLPPGDGPAEASRPAALRPALSFTFPAPVRPFAFAPDPPGGGSALPSRPSGEAAGFDPGAAVRRLPGAGFPDRLLARMEREASRFRRESRFDVAAAIDPEDSFGEDLRAREAERIITRAFDHAIDDQLELLARNGLGLGGVLDWLDDLGRPRSPAARSAAAAAAGGGPAPARRADAGVGLRIGAHPRVVLRGEALGLKGRIEVPLRDEPLRLSIERSFGARGRAVLSGGLDRDGQDWAILALNLRF
jgi:hypothetical protein